MLNETVYLSRILLTHKIEGLEPQRQATKVKTPIANQTHSPWTPQALHIAIHHHATKHRQLSYEVGCLSHCRALCHTCKDLGEKNSMEEGSGGRRARKCLPWKYQIICLERKLEKEEEIIVPSLVSSKAHPGIPTTRPLLLPGCELVCIVTNTSWARLDAALSPLGELLPEPALNKGLCCYTCLGQLLLSTAVQVLQNPGIPVVLGNAQIYNMNHIPQQP